jgi:hypothetical protein
MRNIIQYPILAQDVLDALEHSIRAQDGTIGGVDQFVLYEIKKMFVENPRLIDELTTKIRNNLDGS